MVGSLDRALAAGAVRLGGEGRVVALAVAVAAAFATAVCLRDVCDGLGYAAQLGGVIGTFGRRLRREGGKEAWRGDAAFVRAGVPCGLAAVSLCVAEQVSRPWHPTFALAAACVGTALAAQSVAALVAGLRAQAPGGPTR